MKKSLAFLAGVMLIMGGCAPTDTPEPIEADPPEQLIRHEMTEAIDNSGYSVFEESEVDFDDDGEEDSIKLLTNAIIEDGELFGDDGHKWRLVAETAAGSYYLLYDGYIQLGDAEIDLCDVYNEQTEKMIIMTITAGAGKSITHYTYRDGAFYEEAVYSTDNYSEGGVSIFK